MSSRKSQLLWSSQKVREGLPLKPSEITELLAFENGSKEHPAWSLAKTAAVPLSLVLGAVMAMYPETFLSLADGLPSWTNLSARLLEGLNYLWNFLSEPIDHPNLLFHLPNFVFYSFGILGLKTLVEKLEHRSWLSKVLDAQQLLQAALQSGKVTFDLPEGHTLLFVGKGDFIGMQLAINHGPDGAAIISETRPDYTNTWSYYSVDSLYEGLKETMVRASGDTAGEYVFFPVKDDQIFLPAPKAYDLSPHKLDILCRNIRVIEQECGWLPNPIFIVGDRFHQSFVQSEDKKSTIPKSQDTISLESLAAKHVAVEIFDPTDIVLLHILEKAAGRKIVFRATKEGIAEYKERFYQRLELLGYSPTQKGMLTIGYDLSEDQTEQQTLSRALNDYYPVVLSKNVRDALERNGYQQHEYLYVPELVLTKMQKATAAQ